MFVAEPTWDNDIRLLFVAPYWLPEERRDDVAKTWRGCMSGYFVQLDDYASVKTWSETIYYHLASHSMPLSEDATQIWPAEALECLRRWINHGCRANLASPFDAAERIPPAPILDLGLRVRRDIRSLSEQEIDAYRAKLDDVLRIGDPDPAAPWQRLAYIHSNWCLHYQEAFTFWHRAYLLYFEGLIDMPVPYWDWMAANASADGSDEAGLPQPFLVATYVHPGTGETRPNPLRFAAAKDGCSKLCTIGKMSGPDCRYVQRNPLFYTRGDDRRAEREKLYAMVALFQEQVLEALTRETFSTPQGVPGFPWANLPAFVPPQPDHLYPYRAVNFDGLYEQPHDNFHGWIGPDMADNAFTAFDPIFVSYHANIDRMLEVWLRAHPGAQFTAQTALQPFIGPTGSVVDFATPERWRYTSIGAMAQDSRRIGYDYDPPVAEQYQGRGASAVAAMSSRAIGTPRTAGREATPWVVFDGVRCTRDSYLIDVFLQQPDATVADVDARNPNYVGRFSRIGMGLDDDKGRCIHTGVSRVLNAGRSASALGLATGQEPELSIVVTHIDSGRQLPPDEYKALPGFVPELVWGDPRQPVTSAVPRSDCCATN